MISSTLRPNVIVSTVNVDQMDSVIVMLDGPLPLMVPLVLNATLDSSLPLPGIAKSVQLDVPHVWTLPENARLARVVSRRMPMITLCAMLPQLARAVELFVLRAVSEPVALRPALPAHRVVRLAMDRLLTIVLFVPVEVTPLMEVVLPRLQLVSVLGLDSLQITTRRNAMVSFRLFSIPILNSYTHF